MAIEFITGVPGGGKSYMAARLVVRELRESKRSIATNLALDIPRLCEYLHEKYGDSFDAWRRIRILSLVECCEFWLFRHRWSDIDPFKRVEVKTRTRDKMSMSQIDYEGQGIGCGVLFIIDEVHVMFGAREWAATGADALYYLSQHRKMGDDVVLISQHTKQVEAAFMRMCETFYHCKNLSKWKLPIAGGFFRAPPMLLLSEYKEATASKPPVATRTYPIDTKGIGSIYKTAAGVGFVGGDADTLAKQRGLPAWAFVVCCVCVCLGIWKGVQYAIGITFGGQMFRNAKAQVPLHSRTNAPYQVTGPAFVPSSNQAVVIEPLPITLEKQALADLPKPISDVYCSGRVKIGKGYRYFLTDGRRVDESDASFVAWGVNGLILKDGVYRPNPMPEPKQAERPLRLRPKAEKKTQYP